MKQIYFFCLLLILPQFVFAQIYTQKVDEKLQLLDKNNRWQSQEANSLVSHENADPDPEISSLVEKSIRQQLLKGTWLLEENSKSKLKITSDRIYEYYNNKLQNTYSYSISEASPQCNEDVPVGPKFTYIKWTNVEDIKDTYCYEINTLSDLYLALILIGGPNQQPTVYQKAL